MDAPPPEDIRPFVRIAAHLAAVGVSVPEIFAADAAQGLVLEEDLGDDLFSGWSRRLPPLAYDIAVDALVAMQRAAPPPDLPAWDAATMAAQRWHTVRLVVARHVRQHRARCRTPGLRRRH